MNKKIITALLLGAMLFGSQSCCKDKYEREFTKDELKVSHSDAASIYFQRKGGEKEVPVKTNVATENWVAKSNAPWCKVSKSGDKVLISAGLNENYVTRIAIVTIAYGHQKYDIRVEQLGVETVFDIVKGGTIEDLLHPDGKKDKDGKVIVVGLKASVLANAKEFTIPVKTNLSIDHVLVPDTVDWVSYQQPSEAPKADAQGLVNIKVKLEPNTNLSKRYCTLKLQSSQNYKVMRELLLVQLERGYIVLPGAKTEFTVPASGQLLDVPFKMNSDDKYEVIIPDADKSWIEVAEGARAADLKDKTITFKVKPNVKEQPRSSKVILRSKDNSEETTEVEITINQEKFVPVAPNNVENLTTTSGAGFITLNFTKPEELNYSKIVVTYHDPFFDMDMTREFTDNTVESVKIEPTFKSAGEYNFTVTTYGPTGVATNDVLTKTATSEEFLIKNKVPLTASMVSTNAQEGSEGPIANLVNGNNGDYFHTDWHGAVKTTHFVQFKLDKAIQTITIDYVGRNHNNHGHDIKKAKIFVTDSEKTIDTPMSDWTEKGEITFDITNDENANRMIPGTNTVNLTGEYKYLRFFPTECRDGSNLAGGEWWNMAELTMYQVFDQAFADTKKDVKSGPDASANKTFWNEHYPNLFQ